MSENRVLKTVKGRNNAIKDIKSRLETFNDINGANRMMVAQYSDGLEAYDEEGSGEFYLAVCLNSNTAKSCAAEVYQIETAW